MRDHDLVHLRKDLREPAVANGDWFARRAGRDDLAIVLDLLTERARWLSDKGAFTRLPDRVTVISTTPPTCASDRVVVVEVTNE